MIAIRRLLRAVFLKGKSTDAPNSYPPDPLTPAQILRERAKSHETHVRYAEMGLERSLKGIDETRAAIVWHREAAEKLLTAADLLERQ